MEIRTALAELGRRRREAHAPCRHLNLSQIKNGEYDCDLVSPREKWSGNVNSEVLVFLRDWWGADKLQAASGSAHEELIRKGIVEGLRTNVDLDDRLQLHGFGSARDVYATNLFPWARVGRATYPQLRSGAIAYGLPMIDILRPKLVVAMGPNIYRALHEADRGSSPSVTREQIVECPFRIGRTWVIGQAHPADRIGQEVRDRQWEVLAGFWAEIR